MLSARPDFVQFDLETEPSPQSKVYRTRSPSGSSPDVENWAFIPVEPRSGQQGWQTGWEEN